MRPPTPGRAHNSPHQQPCSRHPALEKRQCECTSKWPPAAQTPAPPPLKQPTGGLLPLPRRLAIARVSQLSLEPLKSCDMFLEGFLTPDESWETTGVPWKLAAVSWPERLGGPAAWPPGCARVPEWRLQVSNLQPFPTLDSGYHAGFTLTQLWRPRGAVGGGVWGEACS